MPGFRFSIPGVPPDPAKGITAFAPQFNPQAGGGHQSYKYAVVGRPGTRGIPVDARARNPNGGIAGQARMGGARSTDAPDAIYPNQYYEGFIAEMPGGNEPRIRRYNPTAPGATTLLPIPAEDGRAAYLAGSAMLSRPGPMNRSKPMPWWERLYSPGTSTTNG